MPTPNPIREPGEDDILDQLRPKPSQPRENKPSTEAEQSRVLPIAYGTCKVPLNLIEKYAPVLSAYPVWTNSTAYQVGDRVRADSKVYECVWAGVSGSRAPRGKDPALDGTVDWEYVQDQPMPIYYQMFVAALCEGQVAGALKIYWDKETFSASPTGDVIYYKGLEVKFGPDAGGQALHGAIDFCGYQHTALLVPFSFSSCSSGTQQEMPAIAVELKGLLLGTTGPDVNPADIIVDVLTHARRGCGLPSSIIGASITGTGAASYRTYCDALGLRLSMLLDSQQTALQILAALFLATNTEACFTGGELKAASLDDQACSSPAFGATNYVPATDAVYDLGPDDFADKREPVQVQRRSDADCFNCFPMEYTDRAQGYARVTVEDPDMVDVHERGGLRRAGPVSLHAIYPDGTQPVRLSRVAAQRSLKIRNRYTFRLPWRFILLEPLDVVTLTEPEVGLNLTPVRILSITEEGEVLSVTAEDYPAGVAAAAAYAPQVGDGYVPAERTTTQVLPTIITGEWMGLADGIVGPSAINQAVDDNTNLVPNGNFEIWTLPATRSSDPPDGWQTVRTDDSHGFIPDPDVWQSIVEPDGSTSQSGDVSIWLNQPESLTAYGIETTELFPVSGGDAHSIALAYMYEDVLAQIALKASMVYYDAAGNYLSAYTSTIDYSAKGVWRRAVHLARAPATARWARLRFYTEHDGPVPAGVGSVWIDSVTVLKAPTRFLATTSAPVSVAPSTWADASLNTSPASDNPAGDYILPPQATPYYFKVASTDDGQQFAFRGSLGFTSVAVGSCIGASIYKNGLLLYQGPLSQVAVPGAQGVSLATVSTPPIALAAGDQIRLFVWHNDTVARAFIADARYTWFAGERVR